MRTPEARKEDLARLTTAFPDLDIVELLSLCKTCIDETWDRDHEETIALVDQLDRVLSTIADAEEVVSETARIEACRGATKFVAFWTELNRELDKLGAGEATFGPARDIFHWTQNPQIAAELLWRRSQVRSS